MLSSILLTVALAVTPVVTAQGALRDEIIRLEGVVAQKPGEAKGFNQLAVAYRRLARWTGDHSAEEKAWKAIEQGLSVEPGNRDGLSLRGWAQTGRHDFEGAVVSANRAIAADPDNSWNYGVLADALTELGRYPEAVKAVTAMMKLRPGVAAYTRAANLRSLHGDRQGAISLMQLAVEASSAADPEGLAWCQVMLGREYQAIGDQAKAQAQYRKALNTAPNYHLALFHLAESQIASGNLQAALGTAEALSRQSPSVAASALIGELHLAAGRTEAAQQAFAQIDKAAALGDPSLAEPRWLARFYADRGTNLDRAIALSRVELNTHQDIETWDGLAWALYRNGEVREALTAAKRAMALGTVSARLLLHRGMIDLASGNEEEGRRRIAQSLQLGDLWPSERAKGERALRPARTATH